MDLNTLIIFLMNGFALGIIIFLIAIGLSLVFGLLKIMNFADGAFLMMGAFLLYQFEGLNVPYWISILVIPLMLGGVGALIEITLLRRIYRYHYTYQILLTFGILLILTGVAQALWGEKWKAAGVSGPEILSGTIEIIGKQYPVFNLFYILAGILVYLVLSIFLYKFRLGKAIRASSEDWEMASSLGIKVKSLYTGVFSIGALLAGFAGVIYAPYHSVTLSLGTDYIILAISVIIIGGMGKLWGTFLASIIVGELITISTVTYQGYEMLFVFIMVAIVLAIRPYGLFGEKTPVSISRTWRMPMTSSKLWGGYHLRNMAKILILGTLIIALILLPLIISEFYVLMITEAMILIIFAMSLNLLIGYNGLLSLGHAGFFTIGAYVSAFILNHYGNFIIALFSGSVIAGTVAFLVGYLFVIMEEVYFAMITLSFGMIVYGVTSRLRSVISGIYNPVNAIGYNLGINPSWLFYYFVLVITVICLFVMYYVLNSNFGLTIKGIRENPQRAEFIGIPTRMIRWRLVIISAIFSGLSGAIYAPFIGTVSYTYSYWVKSMEPILIILIGGMENFFGPVAGTIIFLALKEAVSTSYVDYWILILGVIFVFIVIFFPEGLIPSLERLCRKLFFLYDRKS